jgi:hypothetical protein
LVKEKDANLVSDWKEKLLKVIYPIPISTCYSKEPTREPTEYEMTPNVPRKLQGKM